MCVCVSGTVSWAAFTPFGRKGRPTAGQGMFGILEPRVGLCFGPPSLSFSPDKTKGDNRSKQILQSFAGLQIKVL